jgi:hypothetical protein
MSGMQNRKTWPEVLKDSLVLLGGVALLSWSLAVNGQAVSSASEQSIKAAYLYKFAAYVEWPEEVFAEPVTPLTIGVFGSRSLSDELRRITADRTVGGRPIAVRDIDDEEPLDGVHILFVPETRTRELRRLAEVARANAVLVVTEVGNALEEGSVINFRAVDHRIRFEVSLEAADNSRLRLSSRLLAVAENVQPRRQ